MRKSARKAYQEHVDGYQKRLPRERAHDHVYVGIDIKQSLNHPSRRRPASKNCPANSKTGYARVLLISIGDGRMAATTSICIVSMPRLNAKMPATRFQRPKPSRSRFEFHARRLAHFSTRASWTNEPSSVCSRYRSAQHADSED